MAPVSSPYPAVGRTHGTLHKHSRANWKTEKSCCQSMRADVQNRRTTPLKPLSLSSLSLPLTPFAATIALRLLSRHLRTPNPSTPLQMQHFAAQDRALARTFFLTGPVWLGWTRPKIKRVCKVLERVPLVGLVGDFVEGYLPFVDEYFYCERLSSSTQVDLLDELTSDTSS